MFLIRNDLTILSTSVRIFGDPILGKDLMNTLKPILSVFLIVVMNISTIGIPLAYHYCGGTIESISLASSVVLESNSQDDTCAEVCSESCATTITVEDTHTTDCSNQAEHEDCSQAIENQQINSEESHAPCCADDIVVAKITLDGVTSKIFDTQIATWLAVSTIVADYYSSLWLFAVDTAHNTILTRSNSSAPPLLSSLSFLSVFRC